MSAPSQTGPIQKTTGDVKLFIDGEWQDATSGERLPIINPATEEQIGTFPVATADDLARAAAAAERGFHVWRKMPALERCGIMHRASALLRERAIQVAAGITRENGKTLTEATGEVHWAADFLDWYAEEARRAYGRVIPAKVPGVRQYTIKQPIGPVLALAPWNWPLVTVARKVSPALGAGCSIVVKPAEEAPSAAVALVQALRDAGLPKGVINLVLGKPADISAQLIAAPEIAKISFTGSTPVGKHLAEQAARHMKRITLELGGHAPVVVWEDADLPSAVAKILPIKFRTSGQVCSCPTRFFVHSKVKDEFVRLMSEACANLRPGDGFDEDVALGPLISHRRMEVMQALVDDAVSKGATVTTGGSRVGDKGYFFAPTVMDNVPADAAIMTEEPFGPLVPVVAFNTLDEVIALANATNLGLSAYVFTRSLEVAHRLTDEIESGMVGVNTLAVSMAESPFGGVKESGYGQEGGTEGLEPYIINKFVSHSYT